MRMTQSQFCRHMADTREDLNPALFQRDNMDIVNPILNVIRSFHCDRYFTLIPLMEETELITNYEDIYNELRQYTEDLKKKPNEYENPYNYINLKSSAIMLLKQKYYVRKNGIERMKINKVETPVENPEQILTTYLALPRFVDKYYFRLGGNLYNVVNQVVDASTYNNATTANTNADLVTFKILLGMLQLSRNTYIEHDCRTNEEVPLTYFVSNMFKESLLGMLYMFANFGLYGAMQFFGLDSNCISITYGYPTEDLQNYYVFEKNGIYINMLRSLVNVDVVTSMVFTILRSIGKHTTFNELFQYDFWIKELSRASGPNNVQGTVEKGLSNLDAAEAIFDYQTKKELLLPEEQKRDFFHLLRWMMTNYDELMAKDNMDISIKRRRIGEYIAHGYATIITSGIQRLHAKGNGVSIKKIISTIGRDPMCIIKMIQSNKNMNNLVSYADMLANDNDGISALKFTYKGISGLGESGGKVQTSYQLVDPSHLGIVDLDAITSSPGLSGIFCPLAPTFGDNNQYFSEFQEPNTWFDKLNSQVYPNTRQGMNMPLGPAPEHDFSQDYSFIRNDRVQKIIEYSKPVSPFTSLDDDTDYRSTSVREKVQLGDLFKLNTDIGGGNNGV